jgi:hypothetical protein
MCPQPKRSSSRRHQCLRATGDLLCSSADGCNAVPTQGGVDRAALGRGFRQPRVHRPAAAIRCGSVVLPMKSAAAVSEFASGSDVLTRSFDGSTAAHLAVQIGSTTSSPLLTAATITSSISSSSSSSSSSSATIITIVSRQYRCLPPDAAVGQLWRAGAALAEAGRERCAHRAAVAAQAGEW